MVPYKEVIYCDPLMRDTRALLVADIGGTNSNFGVFIECKGSLQLVVSLHIKSQEIIDFSVVVADVVAYLKQQHNYAITHACIAAAGVVTPDRTRCKPTNLPFTIDVSAIKQKTGLSCVVLANDFEVVGYGLSQIAPQDLVLINHGVATEYGNKVIVGAGTGLGKSIVYWDSTNKRYTPIVSEGGHADLAVRTQQELDLVHFIQTSLGTSRAISWEDVLSGAGIKHMYAFFRSQHATHYVDADLATNGLHPDAIFNNRNRDEHSHATFEQFSLFYARCAKNLALDALALGGVYIAGNIAAKNLPLFQQPAFITEFINCGKQQQLLASIPVYVVTDYNVSLHGAAQYMVVEGVCPL